jgi:ribonuclease-3
LKVQPELRDVETATSLNARLGLSFSSLSMLTRALTHRSYLNEHADVQQDNERLEFLGDAVLDFIVGAWVYHRFPEMPEGDLTKMRSAIVRNDQLATFSRRLGLGGAMRLGRGASSSGGGRSDGPLATVFEALIGALYLDAGLGAAERFVLPLLEDARETILIEVDNPKSRLQEWAHAEKLEAPRYHTLAASGPDHAKEFEVDVELGGEMRGRGRGSSKNAAQQRAAQAAIRNLGIS